MKTDKDPVQKKGGGVLGFIERVGNALPDPSILFLILAVFMILLSAVGAALGCRER